MDKETAKENLKIIIEKYNKFKDSDALKVEANAEKIIEDIFEKVLGWESLEDYVKRKSQETGKFPDYTFRLNGINKFFLEAKKLDANLDTLAFQKQAIGYARSSAVPFGILTNFREIRVYVVDREIDNLKNFDKIQLFKPILIEKCLEDNEFDKLWMFSKESFLNKKTYSFAEEICKLPKRKDIDDQLSIKLNILREKIKSNIKKHEKKNEAVLSDANAKLLIEEVTQRILDRLVFIRVCEDREYENKYLERFFNAYEQNNSFKVWDAIKGLFRDYDKKNEKTGVGGYNSGLFESSLCDTLFIDDEVLAKVVNEFYYFEDGTPIDFSKIPADILGNLYENYLSHISRNIETQKSHRKEQGIYYTPTYIVDYIVRNTLGELLKDKKVNVEKIRVLDPSCGSGSFLIKAFDIIDEHYKKKEGYNQKTLGNDGLIYSAKERILKNNIFGVDLDKQAVEIAQLNLLLKIAEKGHKLPLLKQNIQNGNSLIDKPDIVGEDKAFNWNERFKQIMDEGGFDVIIGNPPWLMAGYHVTNKEMQFLHDNYLSATGKFDMYYCFIEKSLKLISKNGIAGIIVPNKFFHTKSAKGLRDVLIKSEKIYKIIDFGYEKIFGDATNYSSIILLKPGVHKKILYAQMNSNLEIIKEAKIDLSSLNDASFYFGDQLERAIFEKIESIGTPLKEIVLRFGTGAQTGADKLLLIGEDKIEEFGEEKNLLHKIFRGRDVRRYSISNHPKLAIFPYKVDNANFKILDEDEIKKYKKIWKVLESNKEQLSKRVWFGKNATHLSGKWYGFMYLDKQTSFISPHILTPSLSNISNFSLGTGDIFVTGTAGVTSIILKEIPENIKYILGLLNSKLVSFYITSHSPVFQGGYHKFSSNYLKNIPIRRINFSSNSEKEQYHKLIDSVDKMLSLNKRLNEIGNKNTSETAKLKEEIKSTNYEIDQEVYKLYGITKEEQKIIEESLK